MAAKKTAKAKATTTNKAKAKGTKPARTKPATAQPADECPKGGAHEWTEDETGRFCSECKEPPLGEERRQRRLSSISPQ